MLQPNRVCKGDNIEIVPRCTALGGPALGGVLALSVRLERSFATSARLIDTIPRSKSVRR